MACQSSSEARGRKWPGKKVSPRDFPDPEGGYSTFRLDEVFDVLNSKKKFNAIDISFGGTHPYVVRTALNNGIKGYVNLDVKYLNEANTISFGQDTATAFYQPSPYFTGDKIKILKFRDGLLKPSIAIYLLASIRKAFSLFSWGTSSFSDEVIRGMTLYLPIKQKEETSPKEIDFEFMESRICELEESRIHELEAYLFEAGFENCELSELEHSALAKFKNGLVKFADFSIVNDVFYVSNSHNILKTDIVLGSGTTPYVTAGASNNSVMGYISYKDDMKEPGNTILIGGKTMAITYQSEAFFSNDSHNLILNLRDNGNRREDTYLFMVAALIRSIGHKYHWGDSISKSKIQRDIITLPVKADGNIDYEIMTAIISASKKLIIQHLKDFVETEHKVYEQIVDSQI